MVYYYIINECRYWKAGREWMHSISSKTPTLQRQPIEGRKTKEWRTNRERAAQANKEGLTLLFKPASPTPSNMLSPRSFHIDSVRSTNVQRYYEVRQREVHKNTNERPRHHVEPALAQKAQPVHHKVEAHRIKCQTCLGFLTFMYVEATPGVTFGCIDLWVGRSVLLYNNFVWSYFFSPTLLDSMFLLAICFSVIIYFFLINYFPVRTVIPMGAPFSFFRYLEVTILVFRRSRIRGPLAAASLVICGLHFHHALEAQFELPKLRRVGSNGQSIGSTVSDTIVRSWLWSTVTGSCPLGYFSSITASS